MRRIGRDNRYRDVKPKLRKSHGRRARSSRTLSHFGRRSRVGPAAGHPKIIKDAGTHLVWDSPGTATSQLGSGFSFNERHSASSGGGANRALATLKRAILLTTSSWLVF